MNTLWKSIFVLLTLSCLAHTRRHPKSRHLRRDSQNEEAELRRTKRTIFQALLKKKNKEKRTTDDGGVDIDQRNLISKPKEENRPTVKQQVQEIKFQVKLIHEWRDEMKNKTSPEYELLAGNVVDSVANELIADFSYLSSSVLKLTKTKSKHKILADIVIKFHKTEENPIQHLEGIVNNGWISGQKVDSNYFKVLGIINGNNEKPEWHYPEEVALRVIPAMIAPGNNSHELKKQRKPSIYKEIRISIKLKQRYEMFLEDKKSPEFSELSGNVEQAITKIFAHDVLFIEAHVLDFRESEEGRVLVNCAVQFRAEEKYAIEKCQAMISNGDLAGMPVDEQFFVVNAMSESGTQSGPGSESITNGGIQGGMPPKIPQPQPVPQKYKPKPLKYKELRISIKLNQPWNDSYGINQSKPFAIFSGTLEQAVDRGLLDDSHYIDATVLDFLESPERTSIANIAIRFHLEEQDPETRVKNLIANGTLSGLPVDKDFFYVFSKSETNHPNSIELPNKQTSSSQQNTVSESVPQKLPSQQTTTQQPLPQHTGGNSAINMKTNGQKQPAENTPKFLNKVKNLKPSNVGPQNIQQAKQDLTPKTSTKPPIISSVNKTPVTVMYNPYLPQQVNSQSFASSSHYTNNQGRQMYNPNTQIFNQGSINPYQSYLDSSQGTINSYQQGIYPGYMYPYAQNAQQSWYPPYPTITPVTPTYNPYLPVKSTPEAAINSQPTDTTTAQKISNENGSSSSKNESNAKEIEGSMTLEQSWHPYLADKSSTVYKILEQTVVDSIKDIYAQVNEEIVPEVLGFSETSIPVTSTTTKTEKKVGVIFKVSFKAGHKASARPLEQAVASKSVAGILIHQNSLVIAAGKQQDTSTTGKGLTICQQQQKVAESASNGQIGGFVPQCKENGHYKSVQCHALTGFCWCVSNVGVRIQGTEERYKQPNCEGIKIMGSIKLPSHAPGSLLPGSCLAVSVQEMILCGGDIDCHIPLVANKTFKYPVIKNNSLKYELTAPRVKPGRYVISAVLNVGWCRISSLKSKDLIHPGDFHSTTMNDIVIDSKTTKIEKDIEVEFMMPEEAGIKLHGSIRLPLNNAMTSLPKGSCLSIQTKKLSLCTGPKCHAIPTTGNETIKEIEIINNTIPYNVQLPEMEPGTYVVSAVLHMGQCEGDQTILPGDYFNDEMHDYVVSMESTDVERDITVVQLKDTSTGGMTVSGRVLLPTEQPLPSLSCLTVSSRKLIQCRKNNCKIPPVATKTLKNITNNGGIPYNLLLPVATPGKYIISAVVNVGWCKSENGKEWIRGGDFYNEKVHDFEIKEETTVVGRNIKVTKFETDKQKTGIVVHGRVILPHDNNGSFSTKSCLTIKAQEFKLCGGVIGCVNPISAKETFHELQLEDDHVIPYAVTLPNIASGHYIISAVLNVDWCRDEHETPNEWIRSGDYHNEDTQDFIIEEGIDLVEKDIEVTKYIETITGPPDIFPTSTGTSRPIASEVPLVTPASEVITTMTPALNNNNDINNNNNNSIETITAIPAIYAPTPNFPMNSQNDTIPLTNQSISVPLITNTAPFNGQITDAVVNTNGSVSEANKVTANNANHVTSETLSDIQPNRTNAQIPSKQKTYNNSSDGLITLPEGLPKSCQEIRDAGIGSMDGQYIIEARPGCHISIICQDMEEISPKEFLGGPSEDEWRYWHYAVLIKLSTQDKQSIPTGACLEYSGNGRDLLKRVLMAGAQQGNPVAEWRTNISKLLRSRRYASKDNTVITKAKTIYKDQKRSTLTEWGVL